MGTITAILLKKNSAVVITCLYEWADLWIFIRKYEFHVCMDMVRNRDYVKIQHENLDLIRDMQKSPWELCYIMECGIAVGDVPIFPGMHGTACIWKRSSWCLNSAQFLIATVQVKSVSTTMQAGGTREIGNNGNLGSPGISKEKHFSLVSHHFGHMWMGTQCHLD